MQPTLKPLTSLLFFLLGLTACGPVEFEGQDLALRHDVKNNVIELNLTYHGVTAAKAQEGTWGKGRTKELELAVEFVERMAAGDRLFMILVSLFEIDLESIEVELRSALQSPDHGEAQRWLDLVNRFSIESARVYLNEKDQLTIQQNIRINGAMEALQELNQSMHEGLLHWVSDGASLAKEFDGLIDTATGNAWIADAKKGEAWIFWQDQTLVIRVPMSSQSAANLLKAQVRELASATEPEARKNISNMLRTISEIELQDGRLTLRLAPDDQGFLKLHFAEGSDGYATDLVDSLKAKDFEFHKALSTKQ